MFDTTLHMSRIASCDTKVRGYDPVVDIPDSEPYVAVEFSFRDENFNRTGFNFFMEMIPGCDVDQASRFIEMLRSVADQMEIVKDRLHDGNREDMCGIYATNSIHDELHMGKAVKEKI